MIAVLHGLRLAVTIALLVGVYRGSTVALVAVLALLVLAQEIQATIWRRVVADARADLLRTAARTRAADQAAARQALELAGFHPTTEERRTP